MLKKMVDVGDRIPRCYGIAYYDYLFGGSVAYPYPLNWIAGIIHWVWEFYHRHLRDFPGKYTPFSQALDKHFEKGRALGYKEGWKEAEVNIRREVEALMRSAL